MRSSPAFPGCPSKGRPLLANAKHAGQYFRIRISFTLPQHGEVPERSNGEPLSLSGGDREFESCFFQRRICLSWDFIFVVNNPGFPRGEPGKESGRLPGNYQIGGYRRNRRQRLILRRAGRRGSARSERRFMSPHPASLSFPPQGSLCTREALYFSRAHFNHSPLSTGGDALIRAP